MRNIPDEIRKTPKKYDLSIDVVRMGSIGIGLDGSIIFAIPITMQNNPMISTKGKDLLFGILSNRLPASNLITIYRNET
jgi:hypothetical protein